VVSDYFLVGDLAPGGVVRAEGDHKIHVLEVSRDQIQLDPRFSLDFNRDISTGPSVASPYFRAAVTMNEAAAPTRPRFRQKSAKRSLWA